LLDDFRAQLKETRPPSDKPISSEELPKKSGIIAVLGDTVWSMAIATLNSKAQARAVPGLDTPSDLSLGGRRAIRTPSTAWLPTRSSSMNGMTHDLNAPADMPLLRVIRAVKKRK
jgi:hypothetical protein